MAYSDTIKINGEVKTGESLGKKIDFFTINTTCPLSMDIEITPSYATGADNMTVLDNFVASRGQAIMRSITLESAVADATVYGLDASFNGDDVYVYKFAIEHTDSWIDAGVADNNIITALDGMVLPTDGTATSPNPIVAFTVDTSVTINTAVSKSSTL